jgi:hypothetical protein
MFAHAGITAEGDARVLCAKVTKELMDLLEKKAHTENLSELENAIEEHEKLKGMGSGIDTSSATHHVDDKSAGDETSNANRIGEGKPR